jgi:hypothetical protein
MSLIYNPKYTSIDAVKQEIGAKVGYSNSDSRFPNDNLLLGYIKNAENYIERKLSRLYQTPFTADDGDTFNDISDEGTQDAIIDACTWRAAILIMRTSFGDSTGIRGESFIEYLDQNLTEFIDTQTARNKQGMFVNPPMIGLKLNPTAAFYEVAGLPPIMVAGIGVASSNIGIRSQRHLTNPNNSWQYWGNGKRRW